MADVGTAQKGPRLCAVMETVEFLHLVLGSEVTTAGGIHPGANSISIIV